jgi:hypothetical protein
MANCWATIEEIVREELPEVAENILDELGYMETIWFQSIGANLYNSPYQPPSNNVAIL